MRRSMSAFLVAACLGGVALPVVTSAENARQEAGEHPRIARAIQELEEAIKYMEAAPHDFGGHKAKAIEASRAAVQELREALRFRAKQDTRMGR